MIYPNNPFILQGYQGKKYFCDRESELEAIKEHLLNDRNVTLYGWRRLGKTALLLCLAEELKEQAQFKTLFIDLSTCRDFYELQLKIVETVYKTFGQTEKSSIKMRFNQIIGALGLSMSFDPISGLPSFSLRVQHAEKETPSLRLLFDFLSSLNKNILIVFDEFQQINHFPHSKTEASIRSITQTYPNLRFAFSGSHRGIMQSMFNSPNRPFYKSTQLVNLEPIEFNHYLPFIQTHFENHNKHIDKNIVKNLYTWCRGETYSIQLLCNRLFAKTINPTENDLMTISHEVLSEQQRLYSEWLNLLPYNQVKLLRAIAKNGSVKNPTSRAFIQENHLGATSSVQTALNGLIDKEIIFKDQGIYFIHDLLFSKWMQSL